MFNTIDSQMYFWRYELLIIWRPFRLQQAWRGPEKCPRWRLSSRRLSSPPPPPPPPPPRRVTSWSRTLGRCCMTVSRCTNTISCLLLPLSTMSGLSHRDRKLCFTQKKFNSNILFIPHVGPADIISLLSPLSSRYQLHSRQHLVQSLQFSFKLHHEQGLCSFSIKYDNSNISVKQKINSVCIILCIIWNWTIDFYS